jgi:hypothetical protein
MEAVNVAGAGRATLVPMMTASDEVILGLAD